MGFGLVLDKILIICPILFHWTYGLSRTGIYELRPTILDTEGVNPFNKYTWQIYTERKDKKHPNHITTIEKTLDTIDENITLEEIISPF